MTVHVVLAGGGTAGHVEPALGDEPGLESALGAEERDADVGVVPPQAVGGVERGLETRLVPERGYDLRLITATPMPRRPSGELVRLPAAVRRSVREVRAVLDDTGADVLVGFGGYVALPAYDVNRAPTLLARPGRALASWMTMGTRPRAARYAGSAT